MYRARNEFFPLVFYTTSHPFFVLNFSGIMFQKFEQNIQQCGKSVFCRVIWQRNLLCCVFLKTSLKFLMMCFSFLICSFCCTFKFELQKYQSNVVGDTFDVGFLPQGLAPVLPPRCHLIRHLLHNSCKLCGDPRHDSNPEEEDAGGGQGGRNNSRKGFFNSVARK